MNGLQWAFVIVATIVLLGSLWFIIGSLAFALVTPLAILPVLPVIAIISGLYYLGLSDTFDSDEDKNK